MKYIDWPTNRPLVVAPRVLRVAAAAAVVALLGACSSTGGKPQETAAGWAAGPPIRRA